MIGAIWFLLFIFTFDLGKIMHNAWVINSCRFLFRWRKPAHLRVFEVSTIYIYIYTHDDDDD